MKMPFFFRESPFFESSRSLLNNSILDDFDNDDYFLHSLIPSNKSLIHHQPRRLLYGRHHHHNDPYKMLKKQLTKAFNKDVFKLVDFCPKINVSEDEQNYYIHADLPGMTKDQVKMEVTEDRVFTLSGKRESVRKEGNIEEGEGKEKKEEKEEKVEAKEEKKSEKKGKKGKKENKEVTKKSSSKEAVEKKMPETEKFSLMECSYGKFKRSFVLPEDVDLEHIQAKMENGVLAVTFQKKASSVKKDKIRTIQIH